MEEIKWVTNKINESNINNLDIVSLEKLQKARNFHKSFPQYEETPLISLNKLSQYLEVSNIYIKDESYRFGLNAFKVLGGSFAIVNYIASKIGCDVSELSYNVLTSEKFKNNLPKTTFFTATDGNHGRGVAWAANKLGQKAVVYMPKGSSKVRLNNILKEGAVATIEDANYDECVRMAAKTSSEVPNSAVIQDTAWKGYEEIPSWIMQGYGTLLLEISDQLLKYGCNRPTHVFVQAGVGSLAGTVLGYFANLYPDNCPVTVVIEAKKADCLYRSALARDGEIKTVDGDMQTIMAGLACGEPNRISWEILKSKTSCFVSCPDWVSALGMRILGAPLKGDTQIISGESGAVGMGLLYSIMKDPNLNELREALKLNKDSKILLISTEGDTDPQNYKNIVWNGKFIDD